MNWCDEMKLTEKKIKTPAAVGLADFAVGMYQVKILNSIALVEAIAFVCGLGILSFGAALYKKMEK